MTVSGSGSGSVTGSGISCPGTCSDSYPAGTAVTLTAAAASGSSFAGWSGAGCSGDGTCTVTMSSAQAVTATFTTNAPPSSTLTVVPEGTGSGSVTDNDAQIVCPSTCSASYAPGSTVILYAAATAGSSFTGWSGAGCTGTAFCVVNMGNTQNVTATFTPIPPSTLTVNTWGSGSGSVTSADGGIDCPGVCSASYAYGTQVTLTAATESGSTFVGWSGGGCSGTGTCVVTTYSVQDVTATFEAVPVASETPGSYYGQTGSIPIYFYVAPDGGSIEDVNIPGGVAPSCTPSGSVSPAPIGIASIPINSDGSFSSTTTQTGLVDNQPATFTYTFSGQFSDSGTVAATWSEDVAYSDNGTSYSCTTGDESVAAMLDANQTGQNTATASPGSYYAQTGSIPIYFYVAPDRGSIEDVNIPGGVAPSCTPSGSVSPAPIGIASIPINSDGSFSSRTTQTGLVDNQPATFTYTFNGHVHGPLGGVARIDGIWREDVTYTNNGTSYDCTTNNQSFAATLDANQTGQNTATASPGSYYAQTGSIPIYFYVAPDRGSIEDVNIPGGVAPSCTPSGSVSPAPIGIASIPINSDGSFSSRTTQTGLVDNQPATFTYTFNGHVHGPLGGVARIDGIWREDVTYTNNGTSYDCTTNNQSFAATLDANQTGQNTATATPGSYTGNTNQTGNPVVDFSVSSDSTTIENVSISASLECSPSGSVNTDIKIASIPIDADGSFTYDETQSGTIDGEPATITYIFDGHVHGPNTSGDTRIDGIWREDITFADNGTSYYCTSNNESYAAVFQPSG